MFTWWGHLVVRLRWWVLAGVTALVVVGATWGVGVFGSLTTGGFDDPDSPSRVANDRIVAEIGRQDADLLVVYTNPDGSVADQEFVAKISAASASLRARPEVASVTSYLDDQSPALVSTDRRSAVAAIQLRGESSDAKLREFHQIESMLPVAGVPTDVGGVIAFAADANHQIESDITRAEMLSLPVLMILMIFIFRGVVAAATPLLVGVVSILGAFIVTRLLASVTDVSVFAVNVITMLGLGMGVDYALFVVSRFREELDAGQSTELAVARTMVTAGRTVVVSGVTVALSLASLLIFPMSFLRSMGFGGMAAVLVAMLAALTGLPALLAVLGHRINAARVPLPRRRATEPDSADRGGGGWARLANSVMARPVSYLVGVLLVLGLLASPFVRAEFGGFDERVLPEGTPSRTVSARIADEFPGGGSNPIQVLVSGASAAAANSFATRIGQLDNVTSATIAAARGESSLIVVRYTAEASADQARALVTEVRDLSPPPGSQVFVAGRPAFDLDVLTSLGSHLPWMALFVGVVTMVLLSVAFGSVVIPVKAIAMNVISISASFGVIVWIFQDGHLAGWLNFTPTGFLEPTNLILMLAILFGLSTDYEVFLLSRVREEWDRTGDNRLAVAAGLQRTGGIITAAALLLIVVIAGFATGGATTIKMLGVGTLVAVAVDAGLVRTLLVPATMRLLGRWNWWAPGPLARLYRRAPDLG